MQAKEVITLIYFEGKRVQEAVLSYLQILKCQSGLERILTSLAAVKVS